MNYDLKFSMEVSMICSTIREGLFCPLMKKNGCVFGNGKCVEINEKCVGCNSIVGFNEKSYCIAYPDPEAKWRNGNCNFASHVSTTAIVEKIKLNPIKASKRS